ncbi:hypothetical protein GGE65_002862 [Skermanella aerolata]|uniref:DUF2946 domain-containing protein n=1 Tax=Skermanella aerolata TaxID=393310 RepID=UPI003D1ACF50
MGRIEHEDHRGQRKVKSYWHRLLAFMAICTLLIQAIVPELAMAAREAAAQQKSAIGISVAGMHQDHGGHEHGAAEKSPEKPEKDQPSSHDRHELCPFCFVKSIQVLPSMSGAQALPTPDFFNVYPITNAAMPFVLLQFLCCLHPRAPPLEVRV